MDKDNKTTPTKKSNDLLFILVGIVKFIKNTYPKIIFVIYIFITIFAWCSRWKLYNILPYDESFILLKQFYMILDILFILIMWVLLPMGLFVLFGKSFSIRIYEMYQNFINNGFVNKKGLYPIVISSKKDKNIKNGRIYEFLNFGLDITEWSNRFSKLENWTDSYITYLDYAKHTKRITEIRYIPTRYYEPFRISTKNNFVSKKMRHRSGSWLFRVGKILYYENNRISIF